MPLKERRLMIERGIDIGIGRQYELLGIHRSCVKGLNEGIAAESYFNRKIQLCKTFHQIVSK